ncbi:MAG: gamma-glutamyltransferase family protein [Acidimicrobiia bacterium]|nr:gamma-glutamyltransferase family protein [Acidimicrobiia bacterium]
MVTRSLKARGPLAVSPHHLASQAAIEIMRSGGNAVDAAVALNAVVGVVRPTDCGIGGDLFALIHSPGTEAPAVLNASGRAGAAVSSSAMRADGHEEIPPNHPAAVTVPGCVDGWAAMLNRFGAMTLGEVLAPAIELAEEGFAVSPEMALNLEAIFEEVKDQPSAFELYPDGTPPAEGRMLRRPALAKVLRAIGFKGREALYGGEVAQAIEAATGGIITDVDLGTNRPDWVEAARLEVFGETAWTIPPNSQGYITLAALAIFEQLNPPADFADPEFHHLLIEAYRAAAWDRGLHLADPAHMTATVEELLHPLRLSERAAAISPTSATWPPSSPLPGGTAYMCTIDGSGLGVSLMQSNFHGIGSGISAGSTGVWLHSRGAGFSLEAGHPNELAPGKRPAHTLAPSLFTRDGKLSLLLGSRGGDFQPQLVIQIAADLLHLGMDPAEAQSMPRWALDAFGPGDASRPAVEDTMSPEVVAGLGAHGHDPQLVSAQRGWGPVSIIRVGADGTREAAADPRVSTAAVAGL